MPEDVITGPEEFAAAFLVSRETIGKLQLYFDALRRWQESINLVSRATLGQAWHRHFADSAQLAGLAPDARLWIDLGSGGGFPAMVIAVLNANQRDFRMHLVESNRKKCAFLAEVARATGAAVTIHQKRIERMSAEWRGGPPDVISARALAPLDRLFGLAAPLFAPTTRGLFLKGAGYAPEIATAQTNWRFSVDAIPSRTAEYSAILAVTGLGAKERVA